ncbi:MAG: histidine kinase [Lacunisphaera sp.]|nr:histidine kinase [Lacunisphaera sp.]
MRNRTQVCLLGWALGAFALASEAADNPAVSPAAPVIVREFVAGGRDWPLRLAGGEPARAAPGTLAPNLAYETVRIPLIAQPLIFHIGPNPQAPAAAMRVQYRLEGWDDEWLDLDGIMFLSLRFLDANGRRISSVPLPRKGRSAGWTGDPRTSPFRTASESVVVPPRARRVQIYLGSGGSPQTTGIWLVKGIRLFATAGSDQPERLLFDDRLQEGVDLGQPEGVLQNWQREGTNSHTPQIYTFPATDAHALALIDTDVRNSGGWAAWEKNIVDVEPGLTLRVEAEEAFSIGRGGDYASSYHKLAAGRYVFRVIPVDAYGRQSGTGMQLPLVIVPPFYLSWWFWAIIIAAGTAALTGSVRYATWKRMQRQLERSERRRAVEAERMRIAHDIHDDMGASLTRISLMSTHALRHTPPGSTLHGELKRMDLAAREVTIALDEIVWAVNPAHDTLEGLCNYISQYVTESVAHSERLCRLEIPTLLPVRFISSGVRHHLLLALKEALNNSLKHSGATEVRTQLVFNDPTLTIVIADNGGGFDPSSAGSGNGIANMNRRLQAAGGTCGIQSATGKGTTVTFTLTLPPEAPL